VAADEEGRRVRFGSLFAGVGGMDLGLERAGMECAWQVEIDPFCRKVLAKHWPDVPKYEDVRDVGGHNSGTLEACGPGELAPRWRTEIAPVDLICGGFPCQPVSIAGKQLAQDDERWLWPEFARIVRELRPRFVLVENVPGLLTRGMGDVLEDLAILGFDAEWDVFGADDIGASQHRKRVWILAYPDHTRLQGSVWGGQQIAPRTSRETAYSEPLRSGVGYWPPGPRAVADIPRMADGPTNRMDRLRVLGNAVVPQVAEWVARRIMEATAIQEAA